MSIYDSVHESTLSLLADARRVHGLPAGQYLVPYRNIRHCLSLQAAAAPDKPFLIHYDAAGAREVYTFSQFNARVHQAAGLLYDDLGVRRGDRVAVLACNHAETVILYVACWLIGAAVAPLNPAEDDARLAFILRNTEAAVWFVRDEYLERARRILNNPDPAAGAPGIRLMVQMGGEPSADVLHFASEIARRPDTFVSTTERPTLDDEALLVYTSGTTGAPKGVVLTQYNLLVDALGSQIWQAVTADQRLMCVLPLHHVNGIVMTLMLPLVAGASLVLNRAFSSQHFWERIAREKVHIVSVVPTLLQFALDFAAAQEAEGRPIWGEGVAPADLRHFRHLMCGAGTLSMALARAFEERFAVPILHGYGLSETTCYSCHLPIDLSWSEHQHWLFDYGYPSIGCPILPNEMAIFSADGSGRELPPGERGEICIRGHNVMRHYYRRPDANAETFRFGWFRSGDEGFYETDSRGRRFFFITGRIKELINRGGVKFSPFDIEEVLVSYPGVKVGLAIGFPNDYFGEEVGAYVVAEPGANIDPDALIEYCRARLTFEKAPKVVVFGEDVPVTTTGKYQRLQLQSRFSDWQTVQFRR